MTSFDEVLRELGLPQAREAAGEGSVLAHCAESIECSLAGYPHLKPAWFRATIGRIVKRRFLARRAMRHDTRAGLPGMPPIGDDVAAAAGADRLRRAIRSFRSHQGPLATHPVFGNCSKAEYEQLHAMHVANHLAALER